MKKFIALLLCVMVCTSMAVFADDGLAVAEEATLNVSAETIVIEETAEEVPVAEEAPVPEAGDEEIITITIDGEKLETDVNPQLVNDRTMVPMRAIFEALGATVTWFEEDQLIFATKGDTMIVLQIGNAKMSVQKTVEEGVTAIELDTAPYLYNSRTLVPVRAVSEALNAKVDWVGETNTVVITK